MEKINCFQCGKQIKDSHFNQKYCDECRVLRREKNFGLPSSLTQKQKHKIIELCGRKNINEIAEEVGISRSGVKRVGNYLGLTFRIAKYSDELIEKVIKYYDKNGIVKTQKKFSNIKARSIIEKWGKGRKTRCRRWKDSEVVKLAKMAGIISFDQQWKVFNRPRAFAGSIKSAWCKNFGVASKYINGMFKNKALYIVTDECPFINVDHYNNSKLYLWVDMEKHLKNGLSEDIQLGISAMANFQRWLWGADKVREKVLKMVGENNV